MKRSSQTFILGSPNYFKSDTYETILHAAIKQWRQLKHHIESHNIVVKVVPGSDIHYDSVYITDAAIIINDFAIMARFHKVARRGEEDLLAPFLKNKLGLRIRYLPKEDGLYFEGGDCRWSHYNTHLWCGYGAGRSTLKGIKAVDKILKDELGKCAPRVHTLRINDRKTFHLDLALLTLPNDRVLYYPTLSLAAIQQLESVFGSKNMIKVPLQFFYACNSLWINETHILVPKLPYSTFNRWMSSVTNMKVHEVDVGQFHLGNGSIQCISLRMITIPEKAIHKTILAI